MIRQDGLPSGQNGKRICHFWAKEYAYNRQSKIKLLRNEGPLSGSYYLIAFKNQEDLNKTVPFSDALAY